MFSLSDLFSICELHSEMSLEPLPQVSHWRNGDLTLQSITGMSCAMLERTHISQTSNRVEVLLYCSRVVTLARHIGDSGYLPSPTNSPMPAFPWEAFPTFFFCFLCWVCLLLQHHQCHFPDEIFNWGFVSSGQLSFIFFQCKEYSPWRLQREPGLNLRVLL